jgi:hypothetical protein
VSEDGPNLDNVKTPAHRVQWQNPGLYQFSLELTVEPYYLDVVGCMTNQALSGSGASFTLSGCGISELDGDYWIAQQDGNEIWVEKNNGWALVFTNDAGGACDPSGVAHLAGFAKHARRCLVFDSCHFVHFTRLARRRF